MELIDPSQKQQETRVTAPDGRRPRRVAAGSVRPYAPAVASAPRLPLPVRMAQSFRRRAPEMQVIRRQLGDRLQPPEVAQDQAPMVESDQSVPPKSLQDAVDVHGGQAQRVGQIGLLEGPANP